MPPADRVRRTLARSDVQTAWILSTVLLVAVLIPGALLYAYVALESLEEADRWFAFVLQVAVRDVEEHGAAALVSEASRGRIPSAATALRLRAPDGALLAERGTWPDPAHSISAHSREPGGERRSLASAWRVSRGSWLVGADDAASGERVELALPLAHFVSESSEIRRRVIVGGAVTGALVLLVAFAVTVRAFAPLRRATSELRLVDAGRLGLRLPTRGTGDPIDAHAETLNRVLRRIDAAFARLRAFSSDAAHELRTPLQRIATVTEVALLEGDERELRVALESIERTVEQLSRVVQSLLLLAEIDEQRLAPRRESIDVASWIVHHAEVYTAAFEEAGVKLVARGEALALAGDRTLLDRVLSNLLDNALAHAPAGSRVEINAARWGDGVKLTVDDAGPGIPAGDRERVFDRFARLEGQQRPGHGLGLALARAIAVLHGGSLRADTSPSGGARFELWLPMAGRSASGG